jgi:U6 snRNA-associated Sm-like protein LSm1
LDVANLVLEKCVERIFVDNQYAELERGTFIVRGENILYLARLV